MNKKNIKNTGFTLVETLVAISIFSMSILGLMSILASGISNTNYAKQKIIAAYLAQEGIEYVRNVRDNYVLYTSPDSQTGWNNFKLLSCTSASPCGFNNATYPGFLCSDPSRTCKLYLNNGNYDSNSASGLDSGFTRKIVIAPVTADELKLTSIVSWTQGSRNYDVTFSEDLFNWVQ